MHFKKTASATLIKPAQVTLDKHNEILGRGSLGVVKKGYYRGEAVVIKSLTFKENGKLDPLVSAEQFIREARALGEINHPTLVELKGIVMGTLSIVFEYMPLGSLKDLIRRLSPTETDNKHGTIKWSDRYQIITDIVEGMRYLHSLKRQENDSDVLHQNLKSSNILITSGVDGVLRAKLADYGMSEMRKNVERAIMTASMTAKSAATVESDDMQMSDIGIKYYGAPELKLVPGSSKYSINCEVYAFGVILLEIVFLRKVTAAIQCFPSRLNDPKFGIPEFLQVLISQCLDAKHPERRPSFDVIFKTLLFQVQTVKQCMDGNHQFDNEESASEMNMLSSGLYYGQQSSAMKSWFSTTISSIKKGSNDYKKQKTSDDRISSIEELNTSADSAINPIVTTKFSAKTSKASSNAGRTHVQRNAIVRPSMTSSQKRKCTNRYILPGVILGLVVIAVSVIAAVMVSRSSAASSGNSSNANDIKSGGSSTNGNNNSSNNNSSSSSSSSPWTGVSSFDLFSFSADKQTQVITNLAAIGVKYIRIYIKSTTRGDYPLNDVEPIKLGVYDDKILTYIDHTMALVQAAGMKLIITLHDRFAFGCDLTDAYTTVLNIKAPCDPADASTDAFYTNASMIAAFEARLGHILSHRNARLSNQPWSQLNSVIYAVDIQSSAEYALSAGYNLNSSSWLCDRAKTLRNSILGGASNPILISTGPGPEMSLSLRTSIFSCNAIDLIGVGDETATDEGSFESAVKSKLAAAVSLGKQYSKQIVFEDFNSGGYSPAEYIKLAQQYGLPWVIWEVSYGGTTAYNPSDFYIQNTYMWNLIKNNSKK